MDGEGAALLSNGHVQDDAFVVKSATQPKVHLANAVDANVARVLVVLELDVDLLGLVAVCPMEVAGLGRVHLEHALLFATALNDLDRLVRPVADHVPGLELNDLGETERIRQILHICHQLIHAVRAVLAALVL